MKDHDPNDDREDEVLRQLARLAAERASEPFLAAEDPRLVEASKPLDAAARARIVERLGDLVGQEGEESPEPVGEVVRGRFPSGEAARPPASGPSPWRFALPLAATLVLAFSIFWLRGVGPGGAGPLPDYTLEVAGATQELRSESPSSAGGSEPLRLSPGNRLRVVLTPAAPAASGVEARAYVAPEGGAWRPVDAERLAVSPAGAVRLDAVVGPELELDAGPHRLRLLVAQAGALPSPDEAEAGQDGEWRVFTLSFTVDGPGP